MGRTLTTRAGTLAFPAFIPVIAPDPSHALDDLVRPYLPRLARSVLVSRHYARKLTEELLLPLWIDSGGFAALAAGASVRAERGLGVLITAAGETVLPREVLDLQEERADVAFTLDFPIPPGSGDREARARIDLTLANAAWAIANRRRRDLPLYGVIHGRDPSELRSCARELAAMGLDGLAIGGLVPRAHDRAAVLALVEAARAEWDGPLHALGAGEPGLLDALYAAGVDSTDSSSWLRLAVSGRSWADPDLRIDDATPTERLRLALLNLAIATRCALPLSARGLAWR